MDNVLENIDQEQKMLVFAVLISITLHVIVVTLLPYLEAIKQRPAVQRIEMEVFQSMPSTPTLQPPKGEQMAQKTPVPVPQKVVEKKVEPAPVLTSVAPATMNDYQVAPQVALEPQKAAPTLDAASAQEKSAPTVAAYGNPNGTEEVNVADNANDAVTPEEAWDGYGQQLYDLVNQGKNYPAIAIRRNWEGEVKLKIKFILGKLASVEIVEMSAHKPLDDEALKMVNNAVKSLVLKAKLAKKTFTVLIPVSFKLDQS